MSDLTQENLEQMLLNLARHVDEVGDRVSLIPKYLIVSPVALRHLLWRPPIRMTRGIRGRKRAISRREAPVLWKTLKGMP